MAIERKKESFTRWDPADYMKSEDDMAAYIEACLEAPDDPALLSAALGDIATTSRRPKSRATPISFRSVFRLLRYQAFDAAGGVNQLEQERLRCVSLIAVAIGDDRAVVADSRRLGQGQFRCRCRANQ
jgi:DNA-binding phage protein